MKIVTVCNFRDENGDFNNDIICSNCHKKTEVYTELQSDQGSPLSRLCKTCLSVCIEKINQEIITECIQKGGNKNA